MKNIIFPLAMISILFVGCASRGPAGGAAGALENKIKKIQEDAQIPGAQILVTEGDKTVIEVVNGVRAVGQNMVVTGADEWHIGSCTKPMTAFMIGQLVDQGKLQWTTTLKQIAPKGYQLHPSVQKITVEQLLSHQSGLADVDVDQKLWISLFDEKMKSQEGREKLVRSVLKNPVRFAPGTQSEYSNSGYVVLGWILEQKNKSAWENQIDKNVFQKLGMTSCGTGPAGSEDKNMARQPWSHQLEGDKLIAIPPGPGADNPSALGPAGTVHCSARDWRQFLSFYLTGESPSKKLVSTATREKLTSVAGSGPFTYSTIARVERPWAQGTAYTMVGSNTMNYAVVAVAPQMNRIYTLNFNAGHEKVDGAATEILKQLVAIAPLDKAKGGD